jgi:hypothetical protein
MTLRPPFLYLGLSLLGVAPPVFGAGPGERSPKQSFEVTSTQRVPFLPGGAIRLESSYGYLSVEGWDEPEVEITVIKSTDRFYEPDEREKAEQLLNQIRVVAELRSSKELAISTTLPLRHGLFASKLPPGALLPLNSTGAESCWITPSVSRATRGWSSTTKKATYRSVTWQET